jgi:hypothetical protein
MRSALKLRHRSRSRPQKQDVRRRRTEIEHLTRNRILWVALQTSGAEMLSRRRQQPPQPNRRKCSKNIRTSATIFEISLLAARKPLILKRRDAGGVDLAGVEKRSSLNSGRRPPELQIMLVARPRNHSCIPFYFRSISDFWRLVAPRLRLPATICIWAAELARCWPGFTTRLGGHAVQRVSNASLAACHARIRTNDRR